MKIIFDLLRNKLVRIIGIGLIFYFGLLSNKSNKEGLGYRLSGQQIQQNISEVKDRAHFIASSIKDVNEVASGDVSAEAIKEKFQQNAQELPAEDFSFLVMKDLDLGEGDDSLKCGDIAEITYDISVKDSGAILDTIKNEKLTIGSKKNALLEQKILGMKRLGVRTINIPSHLRPNDKKLYMLLKFNEVDLIYKVNLINFWPSNQFIKCS